jgi:hypothetical protein
MALMMHFPSMLGKFVHRLPILSQLTLVLFAGVSHGTTFQLERVVDGLNSPTCVTQAPGDTNSLYIVEGIVTNAPGLRLGRILKRDLSAQTNSVFLDLSAMPGASNNNSLHQLEFHPQFQGNGKFYITYQFRTLTSGLIAARLDEYRVTNGAPVFERKILQHHINQNGAHAVDHPFFRPGGDSNHLYVTAGDGGPEANRADYLTNRAQDLSYTYGKLLRIDVSDGLDDYPGDTNRNFGIPAINTSVTNPPGRLGEVIASGFRNPWRASFDALTGDLYIGDNGFHTCEEVDFIKADVIVPVSVAIPDFGWPTYEGLFKPPPDANSFIDGLPEITNSLKPIIARTAAVLPSEIGGGPGDGDDSVIGGYVYRGPITEFYGKYIYGDWSAQRVYACEFDRDTEPALFGGTNVTDFTNITAMLEATLPGADINSVVSFYADHTGDLYIVDYNGEVFKVVAVDETPILSQLEFANEQFSLSVDGATGRPYVVEASSNLLDWAALNTNASPFTNVDAETGNFEYRFYRARYQP